ETTSGDVARKKRGKAHVTPGCNDLIQPTPKEKHYVTYCNHRTLALACLFKRAACSRQGINPVAGSRLRSVNFDYWAAAGHRSNLRCPVVPYSRRKQEHRQDGRDHAVDAEGVDVGALHVHKINREADALHRREPRPSAGHETMGQRR